MNDYTGPSPDPYDYEQDGGFLDQFDPADEFDGSGVSGVAVLVWAVVVLSMVLMALGVWKAVELLRGWL